MPDSAPDYETILYEKRGRVGLITLNRPEKLNAWNPRMESEFIDCVTRAAADREVGALVVTGAGRAFCAGGDISRWSEEIASRGERRSRSPLLEREGSPEVPIALRRGKPVIAAINGPAIGLGATLPLPFDIRIASDRARFGYVFSRVGLVPEFGSTFLLPRIVGLARAKELVLTARIVDAQEALSLGLVTRVVPAERLMDEARELAESIAQGPTSAMGKVKEAIHRALTSDLATAEAWEGRVIAECYGSPEHAEGVRAFIEKRRPVFHRS